VRLYKTTCILFVISTNVGTHGKQNTVAVVPMMCSLFISMGSIENDGNIFCNFLFL